MSTTHRVALVGATGRMGLELSRALLGAPDLELVAAVAADADGRTLGQHHGLPGLPVTLVASPERIDTDFDVLIDFSRPEPALVSAGLCADRGAALVTGTTGLEPAQQEALDGHAGRIALCQAANFSIGVNVSLALAARAAELLDADYDVEIIEAHHRHKVDAPSGTALALGRAVAASRGRRLPDDGVFSRHGDTGPRPAGSIGFATVRGGDIVGEHTVLFAGPGETVELRHRATNRGNFASGALRAARWLVGRTPGRYTMAQVLGLDAA